MRTVLAAALGAALILPGVAFAQTGSSDPSATTSPPATTTSPMTPGATSPDMPGSASGTSTLTDQTAAAGAGEGHEIIGKKLQNAQGDDLGEVSNVLIDSQGQVAGLVVDAAEGDRKVKLDWEQITLNEQGDIEATMQAQELSQLPEYEPPPGSQAQ